MRKTRAFLALLVMLGFWGMHFDLVFYGTSASLTYVGGHITEDRTWSLQESPYVITADCFVDSGTTLTVDPGVVVRFDTGLSLTVSGSLRAVGTESNPITFTSNRPQPAAGNWNTIRFAAGGHESLAMRYCVVEYAVNGVTVNAVAKTIVENVDFFHNSHSGIHIGGPSNVLVKGSSLMFNGQHGISITGLLTSGITLVDNNISFNNETGINLLTESEADTPGYAGNMTFLRNSILFNKKNGIRLYKYATVEALVEKITISNNSISSNGEEGLEIFSSGEISDARISGNNVSCNGRNGINLEISSYSFDSAICDSDISGNIVSFNSESGIFLHAAGNGYEGSIYGVTVLNNIVLSNRDGISYAARKSSESGLFDALTQGNSISANTQCGVSVSGNLETNITANSISYNGYGVFYKESTDNVANYNDIYSNSQGMIVSESATVSAELNYWGNASGPYHDLQNSIGNGNPVNGNGTDLDFEPFLRTPIGHINKRPKAKLLLDKKFATVNETVTFNGSASSDDGRVYRYLFDFGDGFKSGWTTSSMVGHSFAHLGFYNVSLKVMDEYTVTSGNVETELISIVEKLPSLTISLEAKPNMIRLGENSIITVRVTHGGSPVEDATVSFSSDKGGTFSLETGYTELDGQFSCIFTAPFTAGLRECVITANVTKAGFLDVQNQITLIVVEEGGPDLWYFLVNNGWILVGIVVVIVGSLVFIARRKGWRGKMRIFSRCTHASCIFAGPFF